MNIVLLAFLRPIVRKMLRWPIGIVRSILSCGFLEGIEPELWSKDAYFVYFEPDHHEDIRDSVICDDAGFISVTEVKLGEMWEA